jgi:hypothetical protein
MSDPKPPPKASHRLLEDLLAEHDTDHAGTQKVEELHAEMKEAGLEPGRGKALLERAIAAVDAEDKKVVDFDAARARWSRRTVWLAVAAGVLAVLAAYKREDIVAYFSAPVPSDSGPPSPRERTPSELAAIYRGHGVTACERKDYVDCARQLDEALALDPAGEVDPKVLHARAQVLRSQAFEFCKQGYGARCQDALDKARGLDEPG